MTNNPFDLPATSLIQDLGWPTIEQLIHRETSVTSCKCLSKLAPDYLSSCISKRSDRHTSEIRNSATDLLIPRMKSSYGQKSFAFCGAKEWNNLDLRTKLAPSIHCFKLRKISRIIAWVSFSSFSLLFTVVVIIYTDVDYILLDILFCD